MVEAIDWESRLLERGGALPDSLRIDLLCAAVRPLVRLGRNSDANHRLARALDAALMSVTAGSLSAVARDAVLNVVAHPLGSLGASHLRSRLGAMAAGNGTVQGWARVLRDALGLSAGDGDVAAALLEREPETHDDDAITVLETLVRMSAANSLGRHGDALVVVESLPEAIGVDLRVEAALALEAAIAAREVGRHDDADYWIRAALDSEALEPLALVRAHEVAASVAISLRQDRDAATHLLAARRLTPLALAGQRIEESAGHRVAEIDIRRPEDGTGTDDFGLRRRVVALDRALQERTQQLEAVLGRRGGRAVDQLVGDALANGWFELWFQPIRINASGRIGGAEALLRLRHPDRGILHPGAFLGSEISEGTQRSLNEWVIDHACLELARWGGMGLDVGVSINVAGSWVDPDLVAMVDHAVSTHGVDPAFVTVEITEESPLPLGPATAGAIADLHGVGVRIALDDFGTGFSSLDHLLRLDVDSVKIDQRFAARLDSDSRSAAIVAAVVGMSGLLGFDVVIEGIETSGALEAQRRLGVHAAQGFFIGPPRPAAGFGGLLATGGTPEQLAAASGD